MEEYILKPIGTLKNTINDYAKGDITANDLKHVAAGFGIYLQRNKLMMIRIRVTGGEISIKELNNVYETVKKYDVPFIRITTRQNIQLHDVKSDLANSIIDSLVEKGFIFRGGGGDTFRSISVSYDSGIAKESVFDVIPYAWELSNKIYPIDKAFNLPRKIKIAISSDTNDTAFARWQDLGFIATKNDSGEYGFEVYIGGGMGRKSIKAIKAFEFIPAGCLYKCATSMINLFDKHGNRENRSKARIRFIRERLGDEEFKDLFTTFYNNADVGLLKIKDDLEIKMPLISSSDIDIPKDIKNVELVSWKKRFTEATKWKNISLVKIPVSNGNLTVNDISYLLEMFANYSVKFIRINKVHEICILLSSNKLNSFYSEVNIYDVNDFAGKGFSGHILSCIGAKVCPLGLIDSQGCAVKIGEVFDEYSIETKDEMYRDIINSISVSGCSNSCGNPEAFKISVIGSKKKVDGILTETCKIKVKNDSSKEQNKNYQIEVPLKDIKIEMSKILKVFKN
jgi:sulfite reductase beta subunit-like hemoprotein